MYATAVDAYEFAQLKDGISAQEMTGNAAGGGTGVGLTRGEQKPYFHEWATVLPGNICVARKARNATFRNYVAAETASPVVACCACMVPGDESNFYFAGICRSKTVRPIDDGVGPQVDEFFTLSIGGMATILNNSKDTFFPGDM